MYLLVLLHLLFGIISGIPIKFNLGIYLCVEVFD